MREDTCVHTADTLRSLLHVIPAVSEALQLPRMMLPRSATRWLMKWWGVLHDPAGCPGVAFDDGDHDSASFRPIGAISSEISEKNVERYVERAACRTAARGSIQAWKGLILTRFLLCVMCSCVLQLTEEKNP